MVTCLKRADASFLCNICKVKEQSICAELETDEVNRLATTMAHLPVKEGEAIVEQHERATNLYVIVSGSFRLVKLLADGRRQVIGFSFPGDFVGGPVEAESPCTAEALEPSLVCRFSHGLLDELSTAHPGIKDRLLSRSVTETAKAQEHMVILVNHTAEEKVAGFLAMLAKNQNLPEGERTIHLPMSRQDIADYLGLRVETLSRTLAAMRKAGQIESSSGRAITLGDAFTAPAL